MNNYFKNLQKSYLNEIFKVNKSLSQKSIMHGVSCQRLIGQLVESEFKRKK